jgi:predicted N-acetyltransferase YhbS
VAFHHPEDDRRGAVAMIELIKTSHIEANSEFATDVRMLLNDAFPDGAPNELSNYYSRCGIPTTTLILSDDRRAVGHLAIHERQIKIGDEAQRVGLLGEIAIAVDRGRTGLARSLVRQAHEHLHRQSIPFSILFAVEPHVYASSGYKLMQNKTRFLDADGQWKTFVYRGSMYAELLARPWPNQLIDLCGPAV